MDGLVKAVLDYFETLPKRWERIKVPCMQNWRLQRIWEINARVNAYIGEEGNGDEKEKPTDKNM